MWTQRFHTFQDFMNILSELKNNKSDVEAV